MKPLKNPKACENINEVREAIDIIDLEIIQLFTKRQSYVKEIVKFKNGDESIIASERKDQVVKQRRAWAEKSGLDPGFMEDVFKLLIEKNIQLQFDIYHKKDS